MAMVTNILAGELAGRLGRRVVPFMVQGRWRQGPLGQPVPRPPRSAPPRPNPVVRLASSALAVRSSRAAAMRGTRRTLGRSGPGSRALRL